MKGTPWSGAGLSSVTICRHLEWNQGARSKLIAIVVDNCGEKHLRHRTQFGLGEIVVRERNARKGEEIKQEKKEANAAAGKRRGAFYDKRKGKNYVNKGNGEGAVK